MGIFTIKRPVVTEKSMAVAQKGNSYTFSVEFAATKGQIKDTVEQTFGVNVVDVHTTVRAGKKKRRGSKRVVVLQPKEKKAIVTLKEGQKIALFEVQK